MAALRPTLPDLTFLPDLSRKARLALLAGLGLVLAGGGAAIYAQIEGDRGIPPIASNGDFEVSGIEVNTTGKTAEEARANGWKQAQRLAWEKLWKSNGLGGGNAPALDDGTIDGMVSAVVVGQEQIGPHRYIATLGVIFDRARTSGYLGMQGQIAHSAPLLVIPVLIEGGVTSVFETRTPWQKAWAEFRTGSSVIDYVRPSGAGADSLLLTAGQISRRSRNWWRLVLDSFGASDVIMPIAKLERSWPGGPVRGVFTARRGPDNLFLGSFELTAPSEDKLPAMLAEAIRRLDGLYAGALAAGQLAPDPSLSMRPDLDPALVESIVAKLGPVPTATTAAAGPDAAATTAAVPTTVVTVQFVTPDAAAVDAGMAAVRRVDGVKEAATTSLAIGGTSVMRVTFAGDIDALAAALRAGGWRVTQGAGALSIRK
ncbi:heavy-metal-associated domain-containing protein [Novosphingobium fuchskuhlense]|uniref:heavy-metal-associated domain-containing protein n=1 Tax=Novosphingobium fuchskuhlense TaxID=1117702 RepID=UPI000A545A4E|nr:heavy-metal-associated domain-containing protein [Novosphingobium fuchskuhlense]